MFQLISKLSKEFCFTHVSIKFKMRYKKAFFLAILKDAWTVHILLESIQSGFDFARGKQITDKKTRAKYVIFLAAFVFEDIGQVLIQEMYRLNRSFYRWFCFEYVTYVDAIIVLVLRTIWHKEKPFFLSQCLLDDSD